MLELLRIKNFPLIEDVEIEFHQGLNVITGESGAGKSIILRAMDFAMGENLSSKAIMPVKEKGFVELLFYLEDEELLIRREISSHGRSRIYINDKLSSKNRLKELRNQLIIYTSQHEQHRLLRPEYHTRLLDEHLPDELIQEKQQVIKRLTQLEGKIQGIKFKLSDIESKKDFFEYQLEEIKRVSPLPNEDEILLKKREELKNSAILGEKIQQALEVLGTDEFSIIDQLIRLGTTVKSISTLEPEFKEISEEIEHAKEILTELEARLRNYPIGIEEVNELEKIEARLFEIEQLKKKLGKTLDEILGLKEEMEATISKKDELRLELKNLERERHALLLSLKNIVESINRKRIEKAKELAKKLKEELLALGFEKHIEIAFNFSPVTLFDDIEEQRARIIWRPNPGQELQPIDKIASGGELSRIFLAIITTTNQHLPTLIFDEVDSGIGGLTLTRVAQKIKELSKRHQIILITHWPQLAYLADRHFRVHKEIINSQTITKCNALNGEEIKNELARMAGGGPQGKALAQQLLKEKERNGMR